MLLKLALKAGEPQRLALGWGSFWQPFEIGFDGQLVGRVETQQELRDGLSLRLPDGRGLRVQLVPGLLNLELEVQCDGVTVPDSPFHPRRRLERTAIFLYCWAAFHPVMLFLAFILLGRHVARGSRAAAHLANLLIGAEFAVGLASASGSRSLSDRWLVWLFWVFLFYVLCAAAHAAGVLRKREKAEPSAPLQA